MSKRASGEGSIYKTAKGWKVALSVGTIRGKRRRITRNAATRADAVAILAQLREKLRIGKYREPSDLSVDDLLTKWITEHVPQHYEESTVVLWSGSLDRHVRKHFSGIKLRSLKPMHIQAFVNQMITDNVGGRARQTAFQVFRRAVRFALKLEMIESDPTIVVDAPKHTPKKINPFSKDEADKLIEATAGTRWHAMIVITLTCGPRQGELWGLEWSQIDFNAKTLEIRQAASQVGGSVTVKKPKTRSSTRTITLPQTAIDALRIHQAIMLREGHAKNPLVFPAPEGGLMQRTLFRSRYWRPLLRKLGLNPRGFHHVRHTYAALALAAGVPLPVVAQVLGHAKPSTTLDCYGHLMPNQQKTAADAMQRLFG